MSGLPKAHISRTDRELCHKGLQSEQKLSSICVGTTLLEEVLAQLRETGVKFLGSDYVPGQYGQLIVVENSDEVTTLLPANYLVEPRAKPEAKIISSKRLAASSYDFVTHSSTISFLSASSTS